MPVRYLLDTNTASYIIKGNLPNVREHLMRVPTSDVGISTVTEAELRFGVARRANNSRLQIAVHEFLLRIDILAWDSAAATSYAAIRSAMEDAGTPIGNLDMMIAAHAVASNTVLVTHDKVFHRVKQLRCEDWTRPA
jgi:tRNA(fMet)-specific endonuclease VapC